MDRQYSVSGSLSTYDSSFKQKPLQEARRGFVVGADLSRAGFEQRSSHGQNVSPGPSPVKGRGSWPPPCVVRFSSKVVVGQGVTRPFSDPSSSVRRYAKCVSLPLAYKGI